MSAQHVMRLAAVCGLFAAAACSDSAPDSDTTTPDAGAPDTGAADAASDTPDAVSDAAVPDAAADATGGSDGSGVGDADAGAGADAGPTTEPDPMAELCGGTGRRYGFVVSQILFARETAGVSMGLDLDGRVSDFRDAEGCFHPDLVGPDGTPGIDNSFATLMPALDQIGGDAIEGLVQQAVNSGELLLTVELAGLDDLANDDCVVGRVGRGAGTPAVGNDGVIEPHQTFDHHPELPASELLVSELVDGRAVMGPFDFRILLQVFGTAIDLQAVGAQAVLELEPDGGASGFLAASVPLSEIIRLANQVDFGDNGLGSVLRDLAPTFADIYPDENGDCQGISVVLMVQATPAFFFEDEGT